MLDGLDAIDWASLSHAYGPADDVPQMIRDMASPDREVRQKAFFAAYGNIWHQGTVYQATAPAVPFLIELAVQPDLDDRHRLLELLFHLAHGSSYLDVHQHLTFVGTMLKEEPNFDADLDQELQWVQAASAAVAEGHSAYISLLYDDDAFVRRHAARMLTCCPDQRTEVLGPLIRIVESDEDQGTRATALYAVAVIAATDEAVLIETALDDVEPLVRLSAALSSSFFLGAPPSAKVVDTLVDFLDEADAVPYDELVFGEDRASDIGAALARVEGPRRAEVAAKLLDVAEAGKAAPMTIALPLLQLTFDSPQNEPRLEALNPLQRRAVTFIAHKAWHQDQGVWSLFGNMVDILREYGLESVGMQVAGYDARDE